MLHKRDVFMYNVAYYKIVYDFVKYLKNNIKNPFFRDFFNGYFNKKRNDYFLLSMISANSFLARSNFILTLLNGS